VGSYDENGVHEPSNSIYLDVFEGLLSTDSWYMVTVKHDAKAHTWQLYVNGDLENSVTMPQGIGPGALTRACPYAIGDRPMDNIWGYPFSGQIDELAVWNRTLTAEEIQVLYNNGQGVDLLSLDNRSFYLYDVFNGTLMDTNTWQFGSNSSGSSYSVNSGYLEINSGTSSGGGAWVDSTGEFTFGPETLILRTKSKVTAADGGYWGFWGENHDGYLAFSVTPAGELQAFTSGSNEDPVTYTTITGVDPTTFHQYKIIATNDSAKFYVDGVLIVTYTENLPINKPMRIRLDRVSWGQNQTISVDYVELTSIPDSLPKFVEDKLVTKAWKEYIEIY
jgi:hypothetical protein